MLGETINRAEILTSISEKLKWFIREPLLNALSNFSLNDNLAYLIFSCILFCLGGYKIINGKNWGIRAAFFVFCILGSYLPCLIVRENFASYRTLIALAITITYVILVPVFSFLNKCKKGQSIKIILVFCCAIHCQFQMVKGFIEPAIENYNLVRSYLLGNVPKDYDGAVVFFDQARSLNCYKYSDESRYDEWFVNSQAISWALPGLVNEIRQKYGFKFTPVFEQKNVVEGSRFKIRICALTLDEMKYKYK